MDTLLHDIRYAARKLLNTPGFTAIAVLTLAMAIGATTAVFSVVDTVLIQPLPYKNPSQLVLVRSTASDGSPDDVSPVDLADYRNQNHTLVDLASIKGARSVSLRRDGSETIRLNQAPVSANFFSVLGTGAYLGRTFTAGEDAPGGPLVAVLSYGTWRDEFNSNPRIAGQTIRLDDTLYTIVGVAPPGLTYPYTPDVWTAYHFQPWEVKPDSRGVHELTSLGRLKTGVSVASAREDLSGIAQRLATQFPKTNAKVGASVESLKAQMVDPAKNALLTVLGAVVLVLLIACANVANLLLMRAAGRQTEIAVRTALGASRARVTRQLITEHALLTLVAAALGGVFAIWAVEAVRAYGPNTLPRLNELSVNGRMLLVAGGIAIVTGLLFGLAPAMQTSSGDEATRLRDSGRGNTSGRMTRTRSTLVVAEMALAVVLLVGAGLLLRSFARLTHVNPGFQADRTIAFDILLTKRYEYDPQLNAFAANIIDRLRHLPGTIDAGVADAYPFAAFTPFQVETYFHIVGQPPAPPGQQTSTHLVGVSSGYFHALGIPLVSGRLYTATEDWRDTPPVVVVNQAFARKFFSGRSPIGEHVVLGISHTTGPNKDTDTLTTQGEIIGVVGDVHDASLADSVGPWLYAPYGALPFHVAGVMRTSADPATATRAIVATIAEVDPNVSVYDISTMNHALAASVAQPRFFTALLGAFAAIALTLAALGIYGVISYSVSQRTSEIGIRIALGAEPERVLQLVLGGGMSLTAIGLGLGVLGALGFSRAISTLLFGIPPFDPLTYVGVVFGLAAVALLACWVPARRAANVDPVIAMRNE
ncbi:MAG TPA: ABC transporter permease [Gemmatimonadaceae bacterium]|nr:ABC transporter permease [Gemmatimonadaceae bacterium]